MKNIFVFLSLILLSYTSFADGLKFPTNNNPFFGKKHNQIAFGLGQGLDTGWIVPQPVRPVPFSIISMQYSQPTTFFSVPARQSINISQTVGLGKKYGWNWDQYSIPMIYISEDIALLEYKSLYTGAGAGVGFQAKQNERIGSKLLFQFKLTFGYKINECWSAEFYAQHFSNGNTAPENNSYAFYGINAVYKF